MKLVAVEIMRVGIYAIASEITRYSINNHIRNILTTNMFKQCADKTPMRFLIDGSVLNDQYIFKR
jgi:hypothetical protein